MESCPLKNSSNNLRKLQMMIEFWTLSPLKQTYVSKKLNNMKNCFQITRAKKKKERKLKIILQNTKKICKRNWFSSKTISVNWHMLIMIWLLCNRDIKLIIFSWRRIWRKRILWSGYRRKRSRNWRIRTGNLSSITRKIEVRKGFREIWRWELRKVWENSMKWKKRKELPPINQIL